MMTGYRLAKRVLTGCLTLLLVAAPAARAQLNDGKEPQELDDVKIVEKLGEKVPLDLVFRDDQGREVKIGDYFNQGKPVIFTLNYFSCPMLCGLQLNGVLEMMKKQAYTPGKEFELLTVSFESLDTVEIAAAKKANYIREYGRSEAAKGWHFLTGKTDSIKALTNALGFYYAWNPEKQEWMHRAALIICTPDGTISRYLGGLNYDGQAMQTLKMSVVEASGGKVGSVWDSVFLSCYKYDKSEGKYVLVAQNVMKVGAALMVLIMGSLLTTLWLAERKRSRMNRGKGP